MVQMVERKTGRADIQIENKNTHIHYLHTPSIYIYIFVAIMYRNITANTFKSKFHVFFFFFIVLCFYKQELRNEFQRAITFEKLKSYHNTLRTVTDKDHFCL